MSSGVRVGEVIVAAPLRRQKRFCRNPSCMWKPFIESVPQVPALGRFTVRTKAEMVAPVLGIDRTRRGKARWDTDPDAQVGPDVG